MTKSGTFVLAFWGSDINIDDVVSERKWRTRLTFVGNKPMSLHPLQIFFNVIALEHANAYRSSYSAFCNLEISVTYNRLSWDDIACFKGLKTLTSNSHSKWDEYGKRRKRTILWSIQKHTNWTEMWLSWLLQKRRYFCLFTFVFITGSKQCFNQNSPWILLVQPFVLHEKNYHPCTSHGIQLVTIFSPLKIRSGGIDLLSEEIHSITIIHS